MEFCFVTSQNQCKLKFHGEFRSQAHTKICIKYSKHRKIFSLIKQMILTSILSNFLWLDLRESFTLADISKNVCQILHLKRKWSRDRFGIHFWRCRPSKKLSEIYVLCITGTGKSLSEALIFASTNPQYEDRLFIELQVQY